MALQTVRAIQQSIFIDDITDLRDYFYFKIIVALEMVLFLLCLIDAFQQIYIDIFYLKKKNFLCYKIYCASSEIRQNGGFLSVSVVFVLIVFPFAAPSLIARGYFFI